MVVTVSTIFGICWGTDATLHVLDEICCYQHSAVAMPIAHTMVMFKSAVNPFAYALINQRFREKMKGMICCRSSSSASRVHVARNHMTPRWLTTSSFHSERQDDDLLMK